MVPALALAGQGQGGHHHQGHGQDDAQEARHDVVGGDVFRVVAAVDDELERLARRGAGERALQVVL
jgi:hypothetical protein